MRTLDSTFDQVQSKSDLVYERICAAILDGSVSPSERLNVDELARELGVSKIPVREALQRLEIQGLVVQTPFAGARVAPISLRELKGIFLIRRELEGLATRLAALTITEEELDQLRALHAGMKAQHATGELDGMSNHNRRFHQVIAQAAGYQTLENMIETMLLSVARYRMVIRADPDVWRRVLVEHGAILAALAKRDAEEAERAAQEHVNRQLEENVQREVEQLFTPGPPGLDNV